MVQATTPHKREPSPPVEPSASTDLATALRNVVQGVRRHAPGEVSDRAAAVLLSHLVELGSVRATDLAEHACLTQSTISRHVKDMEEAGFLRRRPDPDDKRATVLEVTAEGRALVEATKAQRMALLDEAVAGWSQQDLTKLTQLLTRLAEGFRNQ